MVMRVYSRYFACWRVLPFLVAILLLCSSCTKDEPVYEDVAIGFGARMSGNAEQQETKLQPDATAFDTSDKMGVYGYLVHNGTYGADGVVAYSAPYISNGVIEYDTAESQSAGKSLWHFNPTRYWPNMGYKAMNFYAYWPYVASSPAVGSPGLSVIEQTNSYPYFSYQTDVAGGASKEDFLVAQASGWRKIVDIEFKRPLAKVTFLVKYEDFIGTLGVDLNIPLVSSGTFNYNVDVDKEDGKGWTIGTTADADLKLKYSEQINGSGSGTLKIATCYLIPQPINTFSIIWNYHKEAKADGFLNLEAGKSYTVTLSIQKDHVIRVSTGLENNKEVQKWITITNENEI